jgi:hypothetical protein
VPPAPSHITRVQGWDAENVLTNLDPNQVRLWNETAEPKILVYTWEPSYSPGQFDLVQTLRKAIANAVTIPEPDVGPPQAAHQPRQCPAPPFVFLVANITQTAADALVVKECWSLPSLTFFAIAYSPPAYPFICNLKNLHYVEEDKPKVLKLIQDMVRDNTQARACIACYNTNPEAFEQIIDSLQIEPLLVSLPASDGGRTRLTWNVYATPPSQNAKRNNEWRRVVSSLTFVMTFHGASQANKTLRPCSGCRSLDHPRGLCPFPLMDGWIEPPRKTRRRRPRPEEEDRNAAITGTSGGVGAELET